MASKTTDPKQIAAFHTLARQICNGDSDEKFEEALRRLMAPSHVSNVSLQSDDAPQDDQHPAKQAE
jgi:hypothetical protein